MSEATPNAAMPFPVPDAGGYQPLHAAPEPDPFVLQRQIRQAEEYRDEQRLKGILADYAAVRGPEDPWTPKEQQERYAQKQRQASARALLRQVLAQQYIDDKLGQLYGRISTYEGRHYAKEEPAVVEQPAPQAAPEPTPAPAPVEVPAPTPEPELPQVAEPAPQAAPAPGPRHAKSYADHARQVLPKHRAERPGLLSRLKHAWYAAGAAFAGYFTDPEKGRRRKVLAAVGTYATVAGLGWLLGDRLPSDGPDIPQAAPDAPNPADVYPTIYANDPNSPQYQNHAYEWNYAAYHFGDGQATPYLQSLIEHARARGAEVVTWGDPQTDQWGITSVTIPLPGGGQRTYYDTQHKLAMLQSMSSWPQS